MTCDACIFFFYSVHVCMQFTNKSLQYVQLYTCEFNFELFITSALLYSYYVLTKYSYHRVLLKTLTLIDVNWTLMMICKTILGCYYKTAYNSVLLLKAKNNVRGT